VRSQRFSITRFEGRDYITAVNVSSAFKFFEAFYAFMNGWKENRS
jgi:hypothetical protein